MNSRTVFCLPYKPFIGTDDFTHVSEILYDSLYARQYITVLLSPKATQNLNAIVDKRPDLKLAVVVNGRLINFLDVSGSIKINRFNIYEPLNSNELNWVYEVLRSSIREQTQNN